MTRLTITTEAETHIVIVRHFAASAEEVYRAHTEAKLLQQWLLGPEGWTMPVCICDARPGGRFRYEWVNATKPRAGFHITGEFIALEPFTRIVHVERMHLPDAAPDNHVETKFETGGAGTRMTIRMTLPDAATRAMMLSSGMEHGMEASYVRLETMI